MKRRQHKSSGRARGAVAAAKGVSWMSLVAATTLGLGEVDSLRARVVADGELAAIEDDCRLIVQSYSKKSLVEGGVPGHYARPLASTQRAITAEELRRGVQVSMVDLTDFPDEDAVVVAWVEQGPPDLDFDARQARPTKGTYYGAAARTGRAGFPEILLHRKVV